MLPWPLLAVQRKKKLQLLKLQLLKLLLLLPKLQLLLLLKPPLLLLKWQLLLLLTPLLQPLLLLLLTNQTVFSLMQKGVPRHPFFIALNSPINQL